MTLMTKISIIFKIAEKVEYLPTYYYQQRPFFSPCKYLYICIITIRQVFNLIRAVYKVNYCYQKNNVCH